MCRAELFFIQVHLVHKIFVCIGSLGKNRLSSWGRILRLHNSHQSAGLSSCLSEVVLRLVHSICLMRITTFWFRGVFASILVESRSSHLLSTVGGKVSIFQTIFESSSSNNSEIRCIVGMPFLFFNNLLSSPGLMVLPRKSTCLTPKWHLEIANFTPAFLIHLKTSRLLRVSLVASLAVIPIIPMWSTNCGIGLFLWLVLYTSEKNLKRLTKNNWIRVQVFWMQKKCKRKGINHHLEARVGLRAIRFAKCFLASLMLCGVGQRVHWVIFVGVIFWNVVVDLS